MEIKFRKFEIMETILIQPENTEQSKAVKAVLKALKVPFNAQKNSPKLTKQNIDQAYKEMREEKYTVIKTADLWK